MEDKLNLSYLFKKSWDSVVENAGFFAPLIFLFYFVPLSVYSLYLIHNPVDTSLLFDEASGVVHWDVVWANLQIPLLAGLAITIISYFSTVAILYFLFKKPDKNLGSLISKSSVYYFSVLAVVFLVGLMLIPLYLALIIPGIIFSVYWAFSYFFVIDEDEDVVNSIKKSYRLVKGNWWGVLGRILLLSLIVFILSSAIKFSFMFVFLIIQGPSVFVTGLSFTNSIIYDLFENVLFSLGYLFSLVYLYYLYIGLKEKKSAKSSTSDVVEK